MFLINEANWTEGEWLSGREMPSAIRAHFRFGGERGRSRSCRRTVRDVKFCVLDGVWVG